MHMFKGWPLKLKPQYNGNVDAANFDKSAHCARGGSAQHLLQDPHFSPKASDPTAPKDSPRKSTQGRSNLDSGSGDHVHHYHEVRANHASNDGKRTDSPVVESDKAPSYPYNIGWGTSGVAVRGDRIGFFPYRCAVASKIDGGILLEEPNFLQGPPSQNGVSFV